MVELMGRMEEIKAKAEDYLMINSYDHDSLTYLIFKEHWERVWQELKELSLEVSNGCNMSPL